VSINLKGVHGWEIEWGDVICGPDVNEYSTESFLGLIIVLNKPKGIKPGYIPVLFIHSAMVKVLFEEIIWVD